VTVLRSHLDPGSDTYVADRAAMLDALGALDTVVDTVLAAGGTQYVDRHHERGRLTARERVDLLLDPDAPFLEVAALAGAHEPDRTTPGAGLICGIGPVSGVDCVLVANEPTVKGGSLTPIGVTKQLRALEIAERNRLPVIALVESGGADLPRQADLFVPGGRTFREMTRLSAAGIPTISLVFGSSTAGGAYMPGMSEYTVFVRGQATVYLGGPPLVKMAINEDVDDETLGGAEMHARESGLADHLAADEHDALRIGRQIVADLGWTRAGPGPTLPPDEPVYPAEELLGCAASDAKRSVEVRDVLARVLDGSRFDEFKPLYGTTLVCGWGSLGGHPVGVLANNGIVPTSTPGVTVSRKLDKLGNRCSDTAELAFNGVRVPVTNTIGTLGRGFSQQMAQFQNERMVACYGRVGACERALDRTVAYLRGRTAFGGPLVRQQYLTYTLAELYARLDMCRHYNYACAEAFMRGEDTTYFATVAKLAIGRLCEDVARTCLQYHGGIGYMEETWTARFLRDMRVTSIGGGADEVMLQVIAKRHGM